MFGVDVEGGKEKRRWGKMEGEIMITDIYDVGYGLMNKKY